MADEPTITGNGNGNGNGSDGSQLFGVSIRGWLAVILTVTVCGIVTTNMILACLGYTSTTIIIPEPLYSGFMAALGFYLGTKSSK